MKRLSELKKNQVAVIESIETDTKLKRRLFEFGILPNSSVKVLGISPLKNTYLLEVMGYCLAVKRDILKNIFVREV